MLYIIPLRRYIDSLCNAVKIPHKNIFAVLALRGDITGKDFLTIFLTVITFYFGTQSQKTQDAIDVAGKPQEDAQK